MLFNWITSMAMLMMPMAIDGRAILAIMATITMANENFSLVIRGIQLKSTKKLA